MSGHLRGLARLVGRHFRWIAAVGTLVGLGLALYSQRGAIADFDWSLSWPAFIAAVCLFALPALLQGISFWVILRSLGVPSRFGETLVIWSRSFLLRYAPTGALAFVLRVRERERLGASSAAVWTASAYEQLASLAGGAIACVVAFAVAGSRPPLIAIGVCAAAVGLAVAIRPRFLGSLAQRLLAARGIDVPTLMRGRMLVVAIALNVAGWLATGAATWTLIDAVSERPTPPVAWLIGVYAFAWLLGFLVPLLPGGLGLRDGTLAVLLATRFGTGPATAIALALRLANTLGELVAVGLVEFLYAARRLRAGTPDAPTTRSLH